jgi:ubiquinone biosynthesis monooxygenase Coq7
MDNAKLKEMIRVNHAGEYGAKRIYQGQLAILPKGEDADRIRHMAEQEGEHLAAFEEWMVKHRVRPSLLLPLWHVGGFAMGAVTALLGREAAYACTVAVESVIDEHYAEQEQILEEEKGTDATLNALNDTVSKFRAEEMEHHDTSIEQGALNAPAYPLISGLVSTITRTAIAVAKKV